MAYVYRHIRLDKNIPFYIGISSGSVPNYARAKNYSRDRSYIWRRIVAKTKYEVEIMIDGLNWDEACEKEKEFIKLYGRINKKTGTLANLTDGGEGNFGQVVSRETRDRLSDINSIPIVQYDLNGKFIAVHKGSVEAAKSIGKSYGGIWMCANLKQHCYTSYGFLWRRFEGNTSDIEFDREKFNKTVFGRKGIKVYDKNGKFLESFISISSASDKYKIPASAISTVLMGGQISAKKHVFRYDDGIYSDIEVVYKSQKGENAPNWGKKGALHANFGKFGKDFPGSKKVNQINPKTGSIVKTHFCIKEAAFETGAGASAISACCRGKLKTSAKFKWEYVK